MYNFSTSFLISPAEEKRERERGWMNGPAKLSRPPALFYRHSKAPVGILFSIYSGEHMSRVEKETAAGLALARL